MHIKHLLAVASLAAAASSAFAQQLQQPQPRPATLEARPAHGPVTVTRDEFLKRAGERFDRLDANKDGTLSPDERHAERKYLEVRPPRGAEPDPGAHVAHTQVSPGK